MADNSTDSTRPDPPSTSASPSHPVQKSARVDFIRAILDFIAKCFYPAILVALLIALYPKLEEIDVRALLGRLQSAKAGDYEFTFGEAEKVGAEIAPLNRKIAELELTITDLTTSIASIRNTVGAAPPPPSEIRAREQQEKEFQANSKYTVLVFHRTASRSAGGQLTKALLAAGFTSSDIETDFSELQKIKSTPGVVHIMYNTTGMEILSDLKSRLERLGIAREIIINPRPIDLRRGDVQILVF